VIALLLILAQAAPAAAPAKDVVVTGRPLAQTARDLAECLARRCPPPEDINATLAHAENQVVAGDYPGARQTLRAGRTRNGRHAGSYPVDVADLMRAIGRVASLNGFVAKGRQGQIDAYEILKKGLGPNDPRTLQQRLEIGDLLARQGMLPTAVDLYESVAKQARNAGMPAVAARALFRKAVLFASAASVDPAYRYAARRASIALENDPDPAIAPFREGLVLLRAQLAALAGHPEAIDEAIAAMRSRPSLRPLLVFAPEVNLSQASRQTIIDQPQSVPAWATGRSEAEWADISFWIAPDGTVRDVEVLRTSARGVGSWLQAVTTALPRRRYAPLALAPTSPGLLRVERYSFVHDRFVPIGSRMTARSPLGRLEVLDMTAEPDRS
jgi:tetratricopeptide (TPR) repeat protein